MTLVGQYNKTISTKSEIIRQIMGSCYITRSGPGHWITVIIIRGVITLSGAEGKVSDSVSDPASNHKKGKLPEKNATDL